jgi:hypothetical protein
MKTAFLAAGALLAFAAPAAAQQEPASQDVKVNQVILYGNDTCPASTDEQINVCAKLPEDDRYRIPENLRTRDDPQSNSWYNRAIELSYVGRTGIGSCSTTGPGGMIGCFNQLVSQARAERATSDQVNWNRLIEEARQERLSKIDEQAAQEEEEANAPR